MGQLDGLKRRRSTAGIGIGVSVNGKWDVSRQNVRMPTRSQVGLHDKPRPCCRKRTAVPPRIIDDSKDGECPRSLDTEVQTAKPRRGNKTHLMGSEDGNASSEEGSQSENGQLWEPEDIERKRGHYAGLTETYWNIVPAEKTREIFTAAEKQNQFVILVNPHSLEGETEEEVRERLGKLPSLHSSVIHAHLEIWKWAKERSFSFRQKGVFVKAKALEKYWGINNQNGMRQAAGQSWPTTQTARQQSMSPNTNPVQLRDTELGNSSPPRTLVPDPSHLAILQQSPTFLDAWNILSAAPTVDNTIGGGIGGQSYFEYQEMLSAWHNNKPEFDWSKVMNDHNPVDHTYDYSAETVPHPDTHNPTSNAASTPTADQSMDREDLMRTTTSRERSEGMHAMDIPQSDNKLLTEFYPDGMSDEVVREGQNPQEHTKPRSPCNDPRDFPVIPLHPRQRDSPHSPRVDDHTQHGSLLPITDCRKPIGQTKLSPSRPRHAHNQMDDALDQDQDNHVWVPRHIVPLPKENPPPLFRRESKLEVTWTVSQEAFLSHGSLPARGSGAGTSRDCESLLPSSGTVDLQTTDYIPKRDTHGNMTSLEITPPTLASYILRALRDGDPLSFPVHPDDSHCSAFHIHATVGGVFRKILSLGPSRFSTFVVWTATWPNPGLIPLPVNQGWDYAVGEMYDRPAVNLRLIPIPLQTYLTSSRRFFVEGMGVWELEQKKEIGFGGGSIDKGVVAPITVPLEKVREKELSMGASDNSVPRLMASHQTTTRIPTHDVLNSGVATAVHPTHSSGHDLRQVVVDLRSDPQGSVDPHPAMRVDGGNENILYGVSDANNNRDTRGKFDSETLPHDMFIGKSAATPETVTTLTDNAGFTPVRLETSNSRSTTPAASVSCAAFLPPTQKLGESVDDKQSDERASKKQKPNPIQSQRKKKKKGKDKEREREGEGSKEKKKTREERRAEAIEDVDDLTLCGYYIHKVGKHEALSILSGYYIRPDKIGMTVCEALCLALVITGRLAWVFLPYWKEALVADTIEYRVLRKGPGHGTVQTITNPYKITRPSFLTAVQMKALMETAVVIHCVDLGIPENKLHVHDGNETELRKFIRQWIAWAVNALGQSVAVRWSISGFDLVHKEVNDAAFQQAIRGNITWKDRVRIRLGKGKKNVSDWLDYDLGNFNDFCVAPEKWFNGFLALNKAKGFVEEINTKGKTVYNILYINAVAKESGTGDYADKVPDYDDLYLAEDLDDAAALQ